jgi:hypothetical protein
MAKGGEDSLGGGLSPKDQGLQVQRAEALQGGWIGPGLECPELELGPGGHPNVAPRLAELSPPCGPSVTCPGGCPPATRAPQRQRPDGVVHGEVKLPNWERQGSKGAAGAGRVHGLPPVTAARIDDHGASLLR